MTSSTAVVALELRYKYCSVPPKELALAFTNL
jgi:hypothetical protein